MARFNKGDRVVKVRDVEYIRCKMLGHGFYRPKPNGIGRTGTVMDIEHNSNMGKVYIVIHFDDDPGKSNWICNEQNFELYEKI